MRRFFWVMALVSSVSAWAQAPSEVVASLEAAYRSRPDAGPDKAVEAVHLGALKGHGDDFEVLWRVARYQQWQADGSTDSEQKRRIAKACWDLGERAIRLQPKRVEGHYFAGACLGAYAQAVGILKALTEGLEGKFNAHTDASIRIDEQFTAGSPRVMKARAAYELPWPKRDLPLCVSELRKVVGRFPNNVRAWVYLAECQLKDGSPKDAKTSVEKALAANVSDDPPEGRMQQARAKVLARTIAEELR